MSPVFGKSTAVSGFTAFLSAVTSVSPILHDSAMFLCPKSWWVGAVGDSRFEKLPARRSHPKVHPGQGWALKGFRPDQRPFKKFYGSEVRKDGNVAVDLTMWISINWERLAEALNSTNLKRVDIFCQAKRLLSDAMDIWDIIHSSKNISWYFSTSCLFPPTCSPTSRSPRCQLPWVDAWWTRTVPHGWLWSSFWRQIWGVTWGFQVLGTNESITTGFPEISSWSEISRGSVSAVSLWVSYVSWKW